MNFDIEEYVEASLLRAKPVQSGNGHEMTAVCPACDKYGGFYVNIESGSYLCNKCEFRGRSVAGLVAQVEQLTWSEARSFIFSRSVKLRRKSDVFTLLDQIQGLRVEAIDENESPSEIRIEPPERYVQIYDPKRRPRWKFPKYLHKRGIRHSTAREWGLGYCPSGKYADRLIIPIDCPAGRSWTARAMSEDVWGPKILNPPGADHACLLIGWHVARMTGDITLVEGPFDALMAYQNHVPAVGLGGKVLHDPQLAMLMTLPRSSAVTIMLDPEEDTAPYDVADRLSLHFDYIYVAKLPRKLPSGEKCDPGNAPLEWIHDAVEHAERWRSSRGARLDGLITRALKRLHG